VIQNERIDEKILTEIQNGYYARLSGLVRGNPLTTESFQALTNCLNTTYSQIQKETTEEQDAREKAATTGLYLDGDTANSDYDIITDIEKINTIIFSTSAKYTGSKNTASKSLASVLR
jgi:hypothetical protein